MKTFLKTATALSAAAFMFVGGQGNAQSADLPLCWAAWTPANSMVDLSKDFGQQRHVNLKF